MGISPVYDPLQRNKPGLEYLIGRCRGPLTEQACILAPARGLCLRGVWLRTARLATTHLMTLYSLYQLIWFHIQDRGFNQAINAIGDTPKHCLGGCDKSLLAMIRWGTAQSYVITLRNGFLIWLNMKHWNKTNYQFSGYIATPWGILIIPDTRA